ncbi:MAG: methyltransferase [Candidatus Cloacimonas sp.]|jgi:tRNA1(Val) A37 N6-methylase TrmN6|nr:methyltransferase [Candidatus Cloacimonas sp.]
MENTSALDLSLNKGVYRILQDSSILGATSATEALYKYTCNNFAEPKLHVVDLGSGSGVLSILLSLANPDWVITGIEIQPQLCEIALANAAELLLKVCYQEADIGSYTNPVKYDLVVSNPPWQVVGKGLLSPKRERAICRSEIMCTMASLLKCCKRNLKPGGQAVLLYPPSRAQELLEKAEQAEFTLRCSIHVDKSCQIFHLQKD